jgi:hypothetical protein
MQKENFPVFFLLVIRKNNFQFSIFNCNFAGYLTLK